MGEWVKTANIKGPTGGTFPDAPVSGLVYGRKDAAWNVVTEEAPQDGTAYIRRDAGWDHIEINADTGGLLPLLTRTSGSIPIDTRTTGLLDIDLRTTGQLPISRTDGSIDIVTRTTGSLPIDTRSTGNLPVDTRTTGNLPLSRLDIHGGTLKATPVGADEIAGANSADGFAPVRWTVTALQGVFQTAFNLLYQPISAALTSWAAITRAAGFDTFVATPSSANLRALLTDETGTGAAVFATSPTLVTPALGTPASGVATNLTGLPFAGLLAAAISTAAEYLSNTASKLASVNALWAAAVPVALTDAATITANFGTFIDSECALGGDRTLGAPSGVKNGQKGVMWFTATGATRNLTLDAAYLLMTGVTAGPYAITTSQLLGVAYVARGGSIYVTSVLRRG